METSQFKTVLPNLKKILNIEGFSELKIVQFQASNVFGLLCKDFKNNCPKRIRKIPNQFLKFCFEFQDKRE